jgi:hypothetical protein
MLTLLVPTVVAIVSWFVGSWLAVRRDRANKRRDLRVQYLIEAYRQLEVRRTGHLFHRIPLMWSRLWQMCNYLEADLRLLRQRSLLLKWRSIDKHRWMFFLLNLRNDLRTELQLENVDGGLMHLRIVAGDKD